ncbi:MAG: hypothetical protein IPL31_17625 [Saprospiraceae bacterium]|nr:hypothetical protein [Saprospiraceae bacterium]
MGIQALNLEVLEKNTDPYSTLLYQPKSIFHPTQNRFGNATGISAEEKCFDFLRIAQEENVALAVTPEYCCPWSVIQRLFDENRLPDDRKLWVLGCESISKEQLAAFIQANANENLIIHYENAVMSSEGNFLDPVCYLLKVRTNEGNLKTLLLIQFKTHHMGVRNSVLENENYIPGKIIYILKNSNISIHLFTLVCSEAERFIPNLTTQLRNEINWDNNPFLIIHPQLNPDPKHNIFTNFRHQILSVYNRKEIISLNWSSLSKLQQTTNALDFMRYSRSAIYAKDIEVDNVDETRMCSNHNSGLFYCHYSPKVHVFYFTNNVEVFKVSNHKVDQSGVAASMQRRQGPRITNLYSWNANQFLNLPDYDDGFSTYLNNQSCASNFLRNNQISFLDKEKVINLSSATIEFSDHIPWHYVERLQSLRIDERETIQRLTFFQDDDADSMGKRNEFRGNINYLNTTIIPATPFPENILFMKSRCDEVKIDGSVAQDKFKYNLITTDGKDKATIAYVGEKENDQIEKAFENLLKLFPNNDNGKRKVTVWYLRGGVLDCKSFKEPPRPNDDSEASRESISSEEK